MILVAPQIPDSPHFAMFDFEGLPPQLDELEKVYLWGCRYSENSPQWKMQRSAMQ